VKCVNVLFVSKTPSRMRTHLVHYAN